MVVLAIVAMLAEPFLLTAPLSNGPPSSPCFARNAVELGRAEIMKLYPKTNPASNFVVDRAGRYFDVHASLEPGWVGGVAHVLVSRTSCSPLAHWHTQ